MSGMKHKRLFLDTCALVWLVQGSAQLKQEVRAAIDEAESVFVSAITAWEISLKAERGQLELPSEKPVKLSDAHGNVTDVPLLDNSGVSGNYLSSEGIEGMDVWGKRAKWVSLYGVIENKEVSVVIMDSPDNVGYPTYWHARDYGLFAANPLGQSVFSEGELVLDFKLAKNEDVTFKYQLLIHSGTVMSPEHINEMADSFAAH